MEKRVLTKKKSKRIMTAMPARKQIPQSTEISPIDSQIQERKPDLLERFVPILILASIALAFVVGMLWEKVNLLEKGGVTAGTKQEVTANTNNGNTASTFPDMKEVAKSLGVDATKFASCLDNKKYADKVSAMQKGGSDAGIQGTPGVFILNDKNQGWLVLGAIPYENVKTGIDVALGKEDESKLNPNMIQTLTADQVGKIPKPNADDHLRGNKNPKVYLIEYSDFECPFCKAFYPTAERAVNENKDVGLIYRHFPLPETMHPHALTAALASECIFEQKGNDGFWKFADTVFGTK